MDRQQPAQSSLVGRIVTDLTKLKESFRELSDLLEATLKCLLFGLARGLYHRLKIVGLGCYDAC